MGYTYLQNHKHRLLGMKYTSTIDQQSRLITELFPSGCWVGQRCFILGGGPSLEHFDFQCIQKEKTIGINKSFIAHDTCINYAMDPLLYNYSVLWDLPHGDPENVRRRWIEYPGTFVFLAQKNTYQNDDKVYEVPKVGPKTISFNLDVGIHPGNNSGFGSLMLAVALGANPIYLLGFDMKCKGERTHWHDGYPKQSYVRADRKLARFAKEFDDFAPKLAELEIEVVNLGEDSKLECFRKQFIGDIL